MKRLRGKWVVVTGAGSGIGRALALELAHEGACLALCDLNKESLTATMNLVLQRTEVIGELVDVSQEQEVNRFAKAVLDRCGGADVIINNAGVSLTQVVAKMSKADLEWVFSVNFWGVVHGCSAFLPQLMQKSEAHIVNISSLFGIIPMPTNAAYVASKFAVRGYTETLRIELANTRVGVSCVHPGGVKTGIVRNGRHHETPISGSDIQRMASDFEKIAISTPESAARKIIRGINRKNPRILVGSDAMVFDLIQRISPRGLGRILIALSRGFIALESVRSKRRAAP